MRACVRSFVRVLDADDAGSVNAGRLLVRTVSHGRCSNGNEPTVLFQSMYSYDDFFVNGRQRPFVLNTHACTHLNFVACLVWTVDVTVSVVMLASNPVCELNNLCRRHALQLTCEFGIRSEPIKQTICLLNISRESPEQTQCFEGVGNSKKEAKRNASQCALDVLIQAYGKEVVDAGSLRDAIVSALTADVPFLCIACDFTVILCCV